MLKLRHLLTGFLFSLTILTVCASSQTNLTAVRDTVTNADGTPFNGTVIITWNGLTAPSGGTISPHSTSAHIYNGVLSVLLVPSTTASAGAYYTATYNSNDGTVTWSETWQVPPSTVPLTLNQVRTTTGTGSTGIGGTGTTGTGTSTITLPIPISDVTGLSSTISTINTTVANLSSMVGNLVASPLFVDGETPSGLVNGTNTTFALAGSPSPVTSLEVYRNGLVQTIGVDYTISGNVVSFLSVATPQTGDILQAYYRTAGSGQPANFMDNETPRGTMDGVNTTFTMSFVPTPVLSLKLYRNGTLLRQSADYTVSGSSITFSNVSVTPHSGDVVVAFYRH